MEVNIENVKEFVGGYMESADLFANTRQEVMNCRAIAFGGVLFAQRTGIVTYEEVKEFWEDYALDKFEEIAREKGKGPRVEVI